MRALRKVLRLRILVERGVYRVRLLSSNTMRPTQFVARDWWSHDRLAHGLSTQVKFRVFAPNIALASRKHPNFAMLRSVIRRGAALHVAPATRPSSTASAGTHTILRQRAARVKNTSGWLTPASQSRVLSSLARKSSRATENLSKTSEHVYGNALAARHLQSAFPKKTVISLLVISGLIYYFVDVEDLDWTDDVLLSFQEDGSHATPVHFNETKDDLDHYLQVSLCGPHIGTAATAPHDNAADH